MPLVLLLPHFQSLPPLPYVAGSLLATVLVLNPRVGWFAYILGPCGSFKWIFLRDQKFLLPHQCPLIFTARSYEALFLRTGTQGCVVWPGAGIACSPGVPPSFYLPHMNVQPPFHSPLLPPLPLLLPHCVLSAPAPCLCPGSLSPPVLSVWMNISSLNPWLSTSIQLGFLIIFYFGVSCNPSYVCMRR